MALTYVALASVTVGSGGAASITFSNIPQDATDLMLVVGGRTNNTGDPQDYVNLRFNGSTSGYSFRRLYGFGSGANTDTLSSQNAIFYWFVDAQPATSNTFGNARIYIPNYTASANKSVSIDAVTENNATNARQDLTAGLWANTAAITSIALSPYFGSSFVQYSTASLYKITKA